MPMLTDTLYNLFCRNNSVFAVTTSLIFSLNPAVDLGQVEGGFIQGMGISTGEEIKFNPTTGQILTNNTWVILFQMKV